jgi:nicotinamide-nucleotide amidase
MSEKTLPQEIIETLVKMGKTVAVAESITAGHLQTELASVSGASNAFQGGITAYQQSMKVEHLGVNDALATQTNCVDDEIARQMAKGALKLFDADYAIATCGYAEHEDEPPHAFIAIAKKPNGVLWSERIELSGSRVEAQQKTAQAALNKFLSFLQ